MHHKFFEVSERGGGVVGAVRACRAQAPTRAFTIRHPHPLTPPSPPPHHTPLPLRTPHPAQCNYSGFGAAALDVYFGTFADSMGARGNDPDGSKLTQPADAKAVLGAPAPDFVAYLAMSVACVALWAYAACVPGGLAAVAPLTPLHLALIAGFGPVVVALPWMARPGGTSSFEWKNAPLLHWALGSACCSVPVAIMAYKCF